VITLDTTRILVVEDEGILALDLKNRLQSMGYAVVGHASTGEGAIQQASQTCPDLVLMDIRLKGSMDGIEAAEQIHYKLGIPVVYLTAHSDEATLERAKVTEPFGYLLKPFQERELHTTIEMALYRHKMERRLKESERWLTATLTGIGDAVIATDEQGRIQFMNPVAEALTGWKQAEAQAKRFEQVFYAIHAETRNVIENPAARVIREGEPIVLGDGILLIARDGTEVPIDDSAAPIKDERGNSCGAVVVFRDIGERVRAEQALRQNACELQARNEELDAFSHTVAHDLKAPLNPIIGFAEFLEKEYHTLSDEDLREFLRAIARTGRKMGNIIEELLLLAQVRTADIRKKPLPMANIVSEAQHRLMYMIEEHQAEIISPDTWPLAQGYAPWVEEVWVNYLSNGMKYGGQPPRVQLGATVGSNGMIRFWVQDNGPGLSPEDQAQLFTPFTRLSQARASGHGLGLSVARRIVEKLGGEVGVESEEGQGSVFYFTLPGAE
jgi:PAS domain S-box-containing protein